MADITGSSATVQKRDQAERLAEEISSENVPTNAVVQNLQRQVANAFILYTNYKHYHWQTYGPLFRDLHLLFDEFADAVLATVDDFAERVRMIGQDPVSRPQEILTTASVNVAGHGQTMRQMIEEADANLHDRLEEVTTGAGRRRSAPTTSRPCTRRSSAAGTERPWTCPSPCCNASSSSEPG